MIRASIALTLALGVFAASAQAQTPTATTATVDLRPETADGAVTGIAVAIGLSGGPRMVTLSAPIVYPGAPGAADRMQNIVVSDVAGPVPMTTRDDPAAPGGFPYFRHWSASRAVSYPLRVTYRAAIQPPGGPGGPPFGWRAVGGGASGSGATLLLLPDEATAAKTTVRWDLGALPAGSIASTSLGDGPIFSFAGGPDQLTEAWMLVGPAGHYRATGKNRGFSAAWLGAAPYDVPSLMARSARAHSWLASYFPNFKPTPYYRVFMQFRDKPPYGGGTALTHSFMLTRGPATADGQDRDPQSTLFHEMIHQWVGGIDGPAGVSSWFAEGLTSYYQDVLQLRGGFIGVADYGRAINDLAEDYFTSKARNWSAEAIAKVGFGDEEVRHTPYRRSAMYFHDLDARIRAHSGGRRTLDDLVFPMFLSREKSERFDTATWIAMVTRELGPQEAGRFERLILAGTDTLDPRSDAFGPCFTREATRFDKGGTRIMGYRWVRAAGVADARCARR